MDGSSRKHKVTSSHPRRRSMEEALDPNDFADVFGGPPRTMLDRKFSAEFTNFTSFYKEIFCPPDLVSPEIKNCGKSLPEFRIPGKSDEFYKDIFGCENSRRSRERSRKGKSKFNSSSVLSSDKFSPLRPVIGDDGTLSSFAAKLRPVNVPCRWNSSTMMPEEHSKIQGMSSEQHNHQAKVVSPETISIKVSADDRELTSPASGVSSVRQEVEASDPVQDEHEEDEVMSSYVIEISSDQREENSEMGAVDEAIAWAKLKFQPQTKCLNYS